MSKYYSSGFYHSRYFLEICLFLIIFRRISGIKISPTNLKTGSFFSTNPTSHHPSSPSLPGYCSAVLPCSPLAAWRRCPPGALLSGGGPVSWWWLMISSQASSSFTSTASSLSSYFSATTCNLIMPTIDQRYCIF